jgi:hypothetical protein
MQKIAVSLAALLLFGASSTPGAAQRASPALEPAHQQDCGYVCVYALPVDLGGQLAQTRTPHPQFAEAERKEVSPASQSTWMENPSLMDSSWRQWPSLTDF